MGIIVSKDDTGGINVSFPYNPAVSVHTFYPCLATHLLEANYDRESAPNRGAHTNLCSFTCPAEGGVSGKPSSSGIHIRTVQELLGHKDVSTTMIYTHVLNRPGITVKSPLNETVVEAVPPEG